MKNLITCLTISRGAGLGNYIIRGCVNREDVHAFTINSEAFDNFYSDDEEDRDFARLYCEMRLEQAYVRQTQFDKTGA